MNQEVQVKISNMTKHQRLVLSIYKCNVLCTAILGRSGMQATRKVGDVVAYRLVSLRVFASRVGDQDLIPCRVIPKPLKMVVSASLLNNRHTE